MAESKLTIEFEAVWAKGNLVVPCGACGDLIVSGSNQLCMKLIGGKKDVISATDLIVCNSCYEIITERNVL